MVIKWICKRFAAAIIYIILAFAPQMVAAETLLVHRANVADAIIIQEGVTRIVTSDTPFSAGSISNPAFVGMKVPSSQNIVITGKDSGRATLMLFAMHDNTIVGNVAVVVVPRGSAPVEYSVLNIPDLVNPEIVPVVANEAVENLTIASSSTVIIESDLPFEGVQIENQEMAFVVKLEGNLIYLLGAEMGITTITLLRGGGQPTAISVEVVENMYGVE